MRILIGLLAAAALLAQADPRLDELARSFQSRDFDRAETLLTELTGDFPSDPVLRERLGVLLLRRGALPQAEVQLAEAVRLSPESPRPRLALARVHWLKDDREAAEEELAEVARLGENDAAVQQALAAFHRETGNGLARAKALRRWVDLSPDAKQPHVELAQLFLDHRTPEGALHAAEAGLSHFDGDAQLLRLKGLALYGLGETQAALNAFLEAIDADPSSDLSYASLETFLPDAGAKLPAIIERLETYSIDQPESPVGPFLLGLALEIQTPGVSRVALMLREAVRRAPEFWPAWFELHRPLERAGDLAGAVAALEKTVALNPQHPQARFALSRLYARAKRKAEAKQARLEHHRLMTARREAEERRRSQKPKLPVNE